MRYAITGVAGYIAPRHLQAIKAVNGELVAALDPHDSVGILDSLDFGIQYFPDFERFDRFLENSAMGGKGIDYLSICAPNYLHEAHARLGLRVGANVICEKPLVINPKNLDLLERECEKSGKKVSPILQMRYQPEIVKLKKLVESSPDHRFGVKLIYFTPRGNWYLRSWKGDQEKSGGLPLNIGVHLFDLLLWIFGPVDTSKIRYVSSLRASGELILEQADVSWDLSIYSGDTRKQQRIFTVDTDLIDFTSYTAELHTLSYQEILAGRGFSIDDTRPAIELAYNLSRVTI